MPLSPTGENRSPERITCVLSAILGNRTISRLIAESVDQMVVENRTLWFNGSVYAKHPAPWLLRRSSTLESVYVARRWLRECAIEGPVVANGFGLALAGQWERCAVATDTTPALVLRTARLGGKAVHAFLHQQFRRLAPMVQVWLPVSRLVKRSLVEDYGVPEERCLVTRAPQPRIEVIARTQSGNIVFVGNDFHRKGGHILLECFARKLLPGHRLIIVSNDPVLSNTPLPSGVQVIAGITDPNALGPVYQSADLLVLPTRYDWYSFVICEAAAHGVPSLATRVGGVGELLDESGGLSLPKDCGPEILAEEIKRALGDGYSERAARAGKFAQEQLNLQRFTETMRLTISRLHRTR